jgi:hypothetical protein
MAPAAPITSSPLAEQCARSAPAGGRCAFGLHRAAGCQFACCVLLERRNSVTSKISRPEGQSSAARIFDGSCHLSPWRFLAGALPASARPFARRINDDDLLGRIVPVVEHGSLYRLSMLHSLPMASAGPRDLISFAGLRNMLISDTIKLRNCGHRFRPNQRMKLGTRHTQHLASLSHPMAKVMSVTPSTGAAHTPARP